MSATYAFDVFTSLDGFGAASGDWTQRLGQAATRTPRVTACCLRAAAANGFGVGLVDQVQVSVFPVITGQHGLEPIVAGAADFDLELIERRTLDHEIQEHPGADLPADGAPLTSWPSKTGEGNPITR